MPKRRDISGRRFGMLVAVRPSHDIFYAGKRISTWLCECDCGGHKDVPTTRLIQGCTSSCGCLGVSEGLRKFHALHSDTPKHYGAGESKFVFYQKAKNATCRCGCGLSADPIYHNEGHRLKAVAIRDKKRKEKLREQK